MTVLVDEQCKRYERRDAQRNLERVMRAAAELFAERGHESVRMEDVAQHAGVGVGTIYRRFRSKEELFAAVSRDACQAARETLQAVVCSAGTPIERLRSLVIVQYRRNVEHAALLDPRQGMGHAACGVFDQQQLQSALYAMLEELIGEGQHAGMLRAGNTAVLAALCLELLNPRVFQHLAQYGVSSDQLAEYAADFVTQALKG